MWARKGIVDTTGGKQEVFPLNVVRRESRVPDCECWTRTGMRVKRAHWTRAEQERGRLQLAVENTLKKRAGFPTIGNIKRWILSGCMKPRALAGAELGSKRCIVTTKHTTAGIR